MRKSKISKVLLVTILTVTLMLSCLTVAFAENESTTLYADALNNLGLFKGTGNGYELDGVLNREQAIVMVVRLLGAEEEALEKNYQHPFKDVPDWADPYIGYAYANWITSGISLDVFGAGQQVTEAQFITFLLRVLGYEDGVEFTWRDPYTLAYEIDLLSDDAVPQGDGEIFTRGNAAELIWRALNTKTAEGEFLYTELIEKGVFTEEQMAASEMIVNPETTVVIEETEEEDEVVLEDPAEEDEQSSSSSSSGSSSSSSSSGGNWWGGGSTSGGSSSGGSSSGDSGSSSGGSSSDDSGGSSGGSGSGDSGSDSGGSDSGDSGSDSGGSDSGDSGSGSAGSGSGSAGSNETEDIPL